MGFRMIVWQPIVHLATQAVWGHEALARFTDATPEEAFNQAARLGPSYEHFLDRACLTEAIRKVPPQGWVFLNLRPVSVAEQWPDLDPTLATRVVWELPEGRGWQPDQVPLDRRIALDDVGGGYQELMRLAQVPWWCLKLDRSLILAAVRESPTRSVIRDLVAMARDRDGAVIGEGVEVPHEAAMLVELGVRYGQGYLWGRPAPLEALQEA